MELEQLERLRYEDTPPPPPPPTWLPIPLSHIESKVKRSQSQSYKFKQFVKNYHYTQHTFWSCLIRCANMKWGHDSVHRRTDGQTDGQDETSIPPPPPFKLRWSEGYNYPYPIRTHTLSPTAHPDSTYPKRQLIKKINLLGWLVQHTTKN